MTDSKKPAPDERAEKASAFFPRNLRERPLDETLPDMDRFCLAVDGSAGPPLDQTIAEIVKSYRAVN